MPSLEQYWERITPLHLILFPASLLFGLLSAFRRTLYRTGWLLSERLPVPVVVVGNLNVGGAGKTPLTLALAQGLIAQGLKPLIVSRGYGGNATQVQEVTPRSMPQHVGDEPLLMARRGLCPVWVGRNRAAAARAALQAHPECNIVLCDDGLQHYRLKRDVEIVVIDGVRGFGNGLLLPAGPLREPTSRLRSVDAVVVNGGLSIGEQFDMRLEGALFHNLLEPNKTAVAEDFASSRNHAVAGIGNPQRYFRHLDSLGIHHVAHPFPDHHPYCADDLAFTDCDAILLTEKDAVKCASFADTRFWVLRVEAQIAPSLTALILRKIDPDGR